MKRTATALILTAALSAPLTAQEARLSGTVAEVYGSQVVLATPEGRLLVTLPQGFEAPVPGTRLDLTGTRDGATFVAREARPAPEVGTSQSPAMPPARHPLPPEIRDLGLLDVVTRSERTKHGDFETHVLGRMPDGTWIRLKTRDGRLVEAKSGGAALPRPLVDRVLPLHLRDESAISEIARITRVEIKRRGEIEVEGLDARGDRVEIEFHADGRLRKLVRERDDRRGMPAAQVRSLLDRLGYRDIGFVEIKPRHAEAIAVNPYGDWVEIRINDRGEVDRERLWHR